jgi:cell fate regulator YaaT (PSP1 superfamily)
MQKSFPKVGAMVLTPKGEGKVKELQILRGTLKVSLGPGLFEEFPLADVQWKGGGKTSDASPVEDETDDPAELKGLED